MTDQRAAWLEIARSKLDPTYAASSPMGLAAGNLRYTEEEVLAAIAEAVALERERSASVCENVAANLQERYRTENDWRMPYAFNRVIHAAWDCAAAIRALGEGEDVRYPPPDTNVGLGMVPGYDERKLAEIAKLCEEWNTQVSVGTIDRILAIARGEK